MPLFKSSTLRKLIKSDTKRQSVEPVSPLDGSHDSNPTSLSSTQVSTTAPISTNSVSINSTPTTPDRATIKLVEPSPPQTANNSRNVSAESEKQAQVMSEQKSTNHTSDQHQSITKSVASDSALNNNNHISPNKAPTTPRANTSQYPIYEQMSRGGNEYASPQSRMSSPNLTPVAGGLRASSPSVSEDGNHWPLHLRGSGSVGKSGRVIEKITAENARLNRELNEKTARLEEAQRSHETDQLALQESKESAMRYQHMYETNSAVLSRRDRKLESLQEALAMEKSRREMAEKEKRDMAGSVEVELKAMMRELAKEKEKALFFQTAHDALSKEFKTGRPSWEPHMDQMKRQIEDFHAIARKINDDREIAATHRARVDEIQTSQANLLKEYKDEQGNLFGPWKERLAQACEKAENLVSEMEETRDKMKWVMNVKQNVKGAK